MQRTAIAAWVRLRPSSRERVLSAWVKLISRTNAAIIERIGGMRMANLPTIPLGPGILVLMNHQSLLDIVLIFKMFRGDYPRIVTRRRYRSGIPLVSHMLRLYDHPIVDPGSGRRQQFDALREMAATSTRPVVILPEGGRTKDGEIQRFRTGGLKVILTARPWSVYVVVADGLWQSARIGGFVRNVGSIRVMVETLGPFAFDNEADEVDAFLSTMHRHMCDKLQAMREGRSAATPS